MIPVLILLPILKSMPLPTFPSIPFITPLPILFPIRVFGNFWFIGLPPTLPFPIRLPPIRPPPAPLFPIRFPAINPFLMVPLFVFIWFTPPPDIPLPTKRLSCESFAFPSNFSSGFDSKKSRRVSKVEILIFEVSSPSSVGAVLTSSVPCGSFWERGSTFCNELVIVDRLRRGSSTIPPTPCPRLLRLGSSGASISPVRSTFDRPKEDPLRSLSPIFCRSFAISI
mmetsp:Transcript_7008/g.10711  ORF Transcript_7008/g.10711 Transcript_7008/m.10711 type:complete len:225 (-) Transcript_7008:648-1322(-)